jgi:hypothetical protein
MPIVDISFENGLFFAREAGHIAAEDAKRWAEALVQSARSSSVPIVILVDAREATSISTEARRIFALASETPNVRIAAIATNNLLVEQQSRMTALMCSVRHSHETHIFRTLEEAEQFARSHLAPLALYSSR